MDLRAADYFLAIAETGSINRAAEKLYISEPALSQYLKRLENELDVTLILRSQNSVLTLTQAGVFFRDYCLAATKLQREMRWDLAQIRTQKKKRLRIGYSPSDPGTWLPGPRIEAFLASSQEIDIVFDTAQALEKRLLNRELDLFFGAVDPKNPALSYTILHSRELDLCVSAKHPLAAVSYRIPGNWDARITLGDAASYPFALLGTDTVVRTLCDAYFHAHGFTPVRVLPCRGTADARLRLITDNAVGFLPQLNQGSDLLVPIALNPPIYYQTGIVWRKDEPLCTALKEFIACCQADIRAHLVVSGREMK